MGMESNLKKIILLVVGAVVVLLLILGTALRLRKSKIPYVSPASSVESSGGANSKPSGIQADRDNLPINNQAMARQITAVLKTDRDLDGLTDLEEKKYGTNPDVPDTDRDGILDRDEIMKYKTDPLNPDTDHDGQTDGYEVLRELNPRGPGRLATSTP